jgi:hypothetical protein
MKTQNKENDESETIKITKFVFLLLGLHHP